MFIQIAKAQTDVGFTEEARAWIGRQFDPRNQVYGRIGLAEGLHERRQGKADKK